MAPNISHSMQSFCPEPCTFSFMEAQEAKVAEYSREYDAELTMLEDQNLLDHANKIANLLNDSNQDSLIIDACKHAIEVTFVSMKKDFNNSMQDIQSNGVYDSGKAYQALLALRKLKYFLDAVENILTSRDPQAATLISSKAKSVSQQITQIQSDNDKNATMKSEGEMGLQKYDDDDTSDIPAVSISAFDRNALVVFDIAVAKPVVLYWNQKPSNMNKQIKSSLAVAMSAISAGRTELPYRVEIRTITSLTMNNKERGTSQTQLICKQHEQQAYHVEILGCVHKELDAQFSVIGEMTLLLSVRPIRSNSGENNDEQLKDPISMMRALRAKAIQTNADPQRFIQTLDLFTSSNEGDDELKIFLRFQTRRCVKEEHPKLIVELTV